MPEAVSKQEKALSKYIEGIKLLDDVLSGLSASDLDLARESGKWTIREIVHHIVDAEEIWKTCIKGALGNPGCTVDLNWYIPDNKCAEPLDYRHRPIEDGIALFGATRRHVIELLKHIPDAWNQSFTITRDDIPKGKTFNIGDVISFQNIHLERHIKQIRDTREKHGL
jgi:hypothetical protein